MSLTRSAAAGRVPVSGRVQAALREMQFDPQAIDPTCAGWFNAAYSANDNKGRCVSLLDLSGSGGTAAQATVAQRPLWTPSDSLFGGRPALNNITNDAIGDGTSLTYTAKASVPATATHYFMVRWGTSPSNCLIANGAILIFSGVGNANIAARPGSSASVSVNTLKGCIICFATAAAGGTSALYVNGANVPGTVAGGSAAFSTLTLMTNTTVNAGNCAMGTYGIFGTQHNAGQRTAVMRYLSSYYSIPLIN